MSDKVHRDPPGYELAAQMLAGYHDGIFAMAQSKDSQDVEWYTARQRGVIPLDHPRLSRSVRRVLREHIRTNDVRPSALAHYEASCNRAFTQVIAACGPKNASRNGTWINQSLADAYLILHAAGCAHSIEIWHDGNLVGGLFGVHIERIYFAESMFHTKSNAGKLALLYLLALLRQNNFALIDYQFPNELLYPFGGIDIEAADYRKLLDGALTPTDLTPTDLSHTDLTPKDLPLLASHDLSRLPDRDALISLL